MIFLRLRIAIYFLQTFNVDYYKRNISTKKVLQQYGIWYLKRSALSIIIEQGLKNTSNNKKLVNFPFLPFCLKSFDPIGPTCSWTFPSRLMLMMQANLHYDLKRGKKYNFSPKIHSLKTFYECKNELLFCYIYQTVKNVMWFCTFENVNIQYIFFPQKWTIFGTVTHCDLF